MTTLYATSEYDADVSHNEMAGRNCLPISAADT
jgi:hypothetical protein